MKDKKIIKANYLTLTYKILITNKIIHSFLFLLEMSTITLQIVEIYYNNYNANKNNNIYFSPYSLLLMRINTLSNPIRTIICIVLIAIIIPLFALLFSEVQ